MNSPSFVSKHKKLIAYTFVAIMFISAFAGIAALIPTNVSSHAQTPYTGTGSKISESTSTTCIPSATVSVPHSSYDEGQTIVFSVTTTTTSSSDAHAYCSDLYIDGSAVKCVADAEGTTTTFTYNYISSSTSSVTFYLYVEYYYTEPSGVIESDSNSSSTGTITVNADPTVTVSSSQNPTDIGNSVTFTASASNGSGGFTYAWYNAGTLESSTASTYNTSFSASGSYNISVTATDSSGYSVSSYIIQSVNAALTISISYTYNPSDKGQDITYDTSVSGGSGSYSSYSYVLYNGTSTSDAELTSGATPSFSYTYSTTGSFLLLYSVTDSLGDTSSSSLSQIVNADPSVSIKSSQNSTDTGLLVEFCPVISGGTPPDSYEWEANDNTYTSKDINVSFSTAGSQTVTLTITDANNYQATASFTETVDSSPLVKAYANMSDVDTGISVEFISIPENGTAPFNFTWSENGIILAYTENYTTSFSSPGTYTLEITTRDSLGVYRYANVTVVVNPNPTVSISVSLNRTDANVGVTFKNVITGGTGPDTYAW